MRTKGLAAAGFVVVGLTAVAGLLLVQELRRSDPVVIGVRRTATFSPSGTGPRAAALSFWTRRSDRVAVSVVDSRGDRIRSIALSRPVPARTRVRFWWDGRDSDGRIVADGRYRFRVGLARQGRSLTLPQSVRLDTLPARPWIERVEPRHPAGPLVIRGPGRAVGIVRGTKGTDVEGLVIRTDVNPAKVVVRRPLPDGARKVEWDGRIAGRPAPEGTYMLGLKETDSAGNRGSFPSSISPLPTAVRGLPGVTVRRLGVSPPTLPAKPGSVVSIPVDPLGSRWNWALRTASGRRLLSGKGRGTALKIRLPRRASGLLLLAVGASGSRVVVPITVNARPSSLLVVLPAIRWQGVAPVDQDGDGLPDTLPLGRPVTLTRLLPQLRGGLDGLATRVVPLARELAAIPQRVEYTTDAALAADRGPGLEGKAGVIFAGGSTWLPGPTLTRLGSWVRKGGRVLDLGSDDLMRTVELSSGTASDPSAQRAADPFGGVPAKPDPETTVLRAWKDEIGLFDETGGRVLAGPGWSATSKVLAPGTLVAAAGPQAGVSGIAAWRLERGLSIRPGLPGLAAFASQGEASRGLLRRAIGIVASGK